MWYEKNWHYALDKKKGFGILTGYASSSDTASCFFEDGSQETVKKKDVDRDSAISNLREYYTRDGYYYSTQTRSKADAIIRNGSCTFTPGRGGSLQASLTHGKNTFTITDAKGTYRYHGEWRSIDHVLVSAPLVSRVDSTYINDAPFLLEEEGTYGGWKPRRTFQGYSYQHGFSDHLPLVVVFSSSK